MKSHFIIYQNRRHLWIMYFLSFIVPSFVYIIYDKLNWYVTKIWNNTTLTETLAGIVFLL